MWSLNWGSTVVLSYELVFNINAYLILSTDSKLNQRMLLNLSYSVFDTFYERGIFFKQAPLQKLIMLFAKACRIPF